MTVVIQGFLLGLANGASCLATCAPVLLPYLLSEGRSVRSNARPLLHFLGGRLIGYLAFAVFAWEAGRWIRDWAGSGLIFGMIYAVLAFVLMTYGFSPPPAACAASGLGGRLASFAGHWPWMMPGLMGLLTGLSLCPPFLSPWPAQRTRSPWFQACCSFRRFSLQPRCISCRFRWQGCSDAPGQFG